jgi:PKD domain
MKKQSSSNSGFINARNLLGALLGVAGISLVTLGFAATTLNQKLMVKRLPNQTQTSVAPESPTVPTAPSPTSGTLTSANIGSSKAINYTDSTGSLVPNLTFFAGSGTCSVPNSCSTFTLTIDPSVHTASGGYDPTQYNIFIEVSWAQAAEDYDTWMCSGSGNCVQANVVASNTSTADPETIILPAATFPAGTYTINLVNTTAGGEPYNGTIYLAPIAQQTNCTGNCAPPRYQNYPAGVGQADDAGEPSIGVDWNPNVASLKDISSSDFTTGTMRKNTGGVAFFKSGGHNWRVNFDDCPSPAVNMWEDVSSTFDQQFVLTDPIGFVDHYSSAPLGLVYPEPHTPGRVFTLDLIGGQGNSIGAFSDNDGNSYTEGGNGGPGQGPDHETLGGGPYNLNSTPPPPPQAVPYPASGPPNAIYYCSQNIVAEAECSRSDDGGQTFGPGVIIYNPSVCNGGIHGHVKVAPDGTVYVPNSSCGENGGTTGVAVSIDNGLTWTENNVTLSSSTQDPSVGIGQNGMGKPAGNLNGTNTIYLGYSDGDGHAKVVHSGDRGAHWSTPVDVGAIFGVTHAVFPVVVAGDDNRAAFGFLGTGPGIATNPPATCDPYGATLNCANIWHLYIATTYDGGTNWITIDATPNDPVQTGTICLQGTFCAGGRNLLDFNDFSVDALGRGVLGYADGCVNCGNTFQGQSSASHGTVARQSGGRRLFAAFDPVEPTVPAAPQMVSATTQPGGTLVSWLEPDNGGSPITGYNVYRGTTSGGETFLAHVTGETTTQYLDTAPPSGNAFYYATAINAIAPNEGTHCGEVPLCVTGCTVNNGDHCTFPYVRVDGQGSAGTVSTDPTMGELTIGKVDIGEPFTSCTDNSITFVMKVTTLDPSGTGNVVLPANSAWQILFGITDTLGNAHTIYVELDTFSPDTPANPAVSIGRRDPCSAGCGTLDSGICTAGGTPPGSCNIISATETKDGYITIKLDASNPITFAAPGAPGVGSAFTWDARQPGTILGTSAQKVTGNTYFFLGVGAGFLETVQTTTGGSYTRFGNLSCNTAIPFAVLSGSPLSGNAPLTVNFDGTASHEPFGACGTINSYTLDFGDGSTPATNGTGIFSHQYTAAGDYPARLTVSDTVGRTSTNVAEVTVSVTSGVNLVSVVSRMQHDSITPPFEVPLPLTGTRGVECRSSASLGAGNYQMVFEFDNALTSVAGVSATATNGSHPTASGAIGLNNHEYVVNLSGVPNQQYVTVTLTGVAGAANGGTVVGPQMGLLVGDVNASGVVTSGDTNLCKAQALQPVTSANFRDDINASGAITTGDVNIIKQNALTQLPTPP